MWPGRSARPTRERLPTQHEHAREVPALLKVRGFDEREPALREYVAGRV
ncbi:hypothetical protein AB0D13_34435 [Streptomyces sp. NPDC048430]